MLVINCANNSTLQDLKTNQSSGVFTYKDTDDFQSLTSNRYIAWRTNNDILELSEHSLNRDLIDSTLKIQFKNTLILPNGVSVHETPEKIYILITTLVSAHRLIFDHPTKLFSNPTGVSSQLSFSNSSATTELLVYSIFHNVPTDHSAGNYCQLPNSATQNTMLGPPSSFPFLACCSWINSHLEAFFVVSKNTGSLHVVKLSSLLDGLNGGEAKVHTIDLKQNSFIGMTMNLITGIVPSLKSTSSGAEAAISLLAHSTLDDDLIFALCLDLKIRVLSLKKQECIITHNLQQNQQQLQTQFQSPTSSSYQNRESNSGLNLGILAQHNRQPISIKLWWHDDNTSMAIPNLVVFLTGHKYKSFNFYETVIAPYNSKPQSAFNSSYSANHTLNKLQAEPHLRFLLEIVAPLEQDLIDYFVSDNQIWALMQHNDTFNLQYYSIELSVHQVNPPPLEWIPVIADVNAPPEMGLRSPLSNSREFYLNEIFWRGNFSLSTIAKAINVSNRISIEEGSFNSANVKIDQLVAEAIKLVDNIIRTQIGENQFEFTVEEYTKLELDAWNQLYSFCLGYHAEENKPLSIFVDYKTKIKGIVRHGKIDFIPSLSQFDELVDYYFLMCKESPSTPTEFLNGGLDTSSFLSMNSNPISLYSHSAFEYRINTLMQPFQAAGVFSSTLEQSILELLNGMAILSRTIREEDMLNFDIFMNQLSSLSSKSKLSQADIAKKITEDSLMPEMKPLFDSDPYIDDFFNKCPMVVEAINFLLRHLSFDFMSNTNEIIDNLNSDTALLSNGEMLQGMQYEILPSFSNLLSSRCGLEFVVASIGRTVNMRYKFCRDLLLFQFMLLKFRVNLRSDYMPKIVPIETDTIPQTFSIIFALDYLNWASQTPMVGANIWWQLTDDQPLTSAGSGLTTIVNATNASPPKNALKVTTTNTSSLENSELLSVLEMREYINLNRFGILSHESVFYDAYPHSNILHFFVHFSGGIIAKRLLSYKLTVQHGNNLDQALTSIWSSVYSSYLSSVCQLLWPFSAGQFKLAEFLLGVGQYDLLERYIQRMHSWCLPSSYSRFFLKGVCYLVTGDGQKAIRQFKQAIFGIEEPFLFKIFAKNAKSIIDDPNSQPRTNSERSTDELTVMPNARTVFRYYNKLIQLFKRYSSPDNVIELVEVALSTLDRNTDPEYDDHFSSLYSTLFSCNLQLGNTTQAYEAMINNTDLDQRRICLRQFILNLCENGQLDALVSFSYQGLEDDFISILESKARASSARFYSGKHFHTFDNFSTASRQSIASTTGSEITANGPINYYHILYTYFIRGNNYRRAAQAMYDYYRRLNHESNTFAASESVELLQRQADTLLIARNCLKLVDPNYSWIIKNALKKTDRSDGNDAKQKLKRKHGYFNKDQDYNHQDKTIIDIVDDDELLSEFELVNARLRLLQRDPKEYAIASTILSPDETVTLCIDACLYEQALRVSKLFNLSLEPIFNGMTSKYVYMLNGAYTRRRVDDEMLLSLFGPSGDNGAIDQFSADPLASPSSNLMQSYPIDLLDIFYENGSNASKSAFISYSSLSICDRMWHLIMHYLARYETSPQKSSHLMKEVAEKLLSNNIMLPASLVTIYKKVNCPQLICLLMRYNFLVEASQISLEYMNAFMGHGTDYFDIKHKLYANCPPLSIPMHIFDCLLKILQEENEESKLDSWQNRLAPDDNLDSLHCTAGSVDDYAQEERIDYEELYKTLAKRRLMLQDIITKCSR